MNQVLQLTNCKIIPRYPTLNAQGEPYKFKVVYLDFIPTVQLANDDRDYEDDNQYLQDEDDDLSTLLSTDELDSLITYGFKMYKSQFSKFISDLHKCYRTYFLLKKKNVPIVTKDYCTYLQAEYGKNKSILSVSGFKGIEPDNREHLNIALKSWYIPKDGEDYVCTKNRIVFDPEKDNIKQIAEFGKLVF